MSAAPDERAGALARAMEARGLGGAEVALVLGSGLGAFADALEDARAVPFEELDGMPRSRVPGHAGRFVAGAVGGRRVLVQQGRVHLYEGWSVEVVTRAVRAACALGARAVVLTNAAGGLRPAWAPGTLMRVVDHLNLTGRTPLAPEARGAGTPYDPGLGAALDRAAGAADVPLEQGVYAGLLGPSYETPAEVRALAGLGADAVGMSTVAEALAAAGAGVPVAAVSCVTNPAAGIAPGPLSHEEVVAAGRAAAGRFVRLLEAGLPAVALAAAR